VTRRHPGSRSRGPTRPAASGPSRGAVALLLGCLLVPGCQRAAPGPEAPVPVQPVPGSRAPARPAAVGEPVSVAIPAVGVDARVVAVGLRPDRTMEVPGVDLAGWYEPGPRPGEPGPAVLVGHVDSGRGPAVFHRLGELRRGDRIVVGQRGKAASRFEVERVERHPKEALPVGRIWSRTRRPVLRLITCGGSFDRSTGHYRDNLVVFADAIS
jgi:hypothetical protein